MMTIRYGVAPAVWALALIVLVVIAIAFVSQAVDNEAPTAWIAALAFPFLMAAAIWTFAAKPDATLIDLETGDTTLIRSWPLRAEIARSSLTDYRRVYAVYPYLQPTRPGLCVVDHLGRERIVVEECDKDEALRLCALIGARFGLTNDALIEA